MRIAIISMQRVFNYGSFLQAYGLKKFLENRGHNIGFSDIEYKEGYPLSISKNSKYIKKIKNIDQYLIKRIIYSRRNRILNQKFKIWQNQYLGLVDTNMSTNGYDVAVIGSDEIFNCSSTSKWGITAQRFGMIKNVSYVLSYAASCGYTSRKDIMDNDFKIVEESLINLRNVSVRDRNTFEMVKEVSGRTATYNLDPVLIYDFKEEIELGEKEGIPTYPYMIVYAYHNRINTVKEIKTIKQYAQNNGLKTISIGGSLPWCDEFAIISPFQVLAYFKHAKCIVTDTFHGTIFSAKLNKPFGVIIRESNKNKLEDLINRLHIENHRVLNMSELDKILNQNDNYNKCNNVIQKGIDNAIKYFEKVGI